MPTSRPLYLLSALPGGLCPGSWVRWLFISLSLSSSLPPEGGLSSCYSALYPQNPCLHPTWSYYVCSWVFLFLTCSPHWAGSPRRTVLLVLATFIPDLVQCLIKVQNGTTTLKKVCQLLIKVSIHFSYISNIPQLGIYSREIKTYIYTKIHK